MPRNPKLDAMPRAVRLNDGLLLLRPAGKSYMLRHAHCDDRIRAAHDVTSVRDCVQ
ncbi:MAG: hypothetical protein LBQ10_02460 [Desulfovibrio sp.]|nr:hypothetical protein [Desulfovibrio sp.]